MKFLIFVCNELLECLREKIYDHVEKLNIFSEWNDFVYSRRYSIYLKNACEILYRFSDDSSFLKHKLNIRNTNEIIPFIASIVCDEGLKMLEKSESTIKNIISSDLESKKKIISIEKTIVNNI